MVLVVQMRSDELVVTVITVATECIPRFDAQVATRSSETSGTSSKKTMKQ